MNTYYVTPSEFVLLISKPLPEFACNQNGTKEKLLAWLKIQIIAWRRNWTILIVCVFKIMLPLIGSNMIHGSNMIQVI